MSAMFISDNAYLISLALKVPVQTTTHDDQRLHLHAVVAAMLASRGGQSKDQHVVLKAAGL